MAFDTTTVIIVVAALAVLALAFLLLRPRAQRVETKPREGIETYQASRDRPYLREREGGGVADVAAAAAADVAGDVLSVDAHRELAAGGGEGADDLQRLKGVGPKFVARLAELGVTRFEQLATMSEAELAMLDERMGPFRGRLSRDRVAEQAAYLARGDADGFEEKFGKLTP